MLLTSDIAALARAAVSGDEKALDLFTWKTRGKGNTKLSVFGPTEALAFFVGGESGRWFIR